MSATELLRSTLEEIELIEHEIVDLYSHAPPEFEHLIRFLLNRHSTLSLQALNLLDDPVRLDQIAHLGGSDPLASLQAELQALDDRFDEFTPPPRRVRPGKLAKEATRTLRRQAREVLDLRTAQAEWQGLKKLQEYRKKEYANILWYRKLQKSEPSAEYRAAFFAARKTETPPLDYISYLSDISDFRSIPRYLKYSDPAWLRYMQNLLDLLVRQCEVHLPLVDVENFLRSAGEKFEEVCDWRESPTWKSELYIPDRLYANANVMRGKTKIPDLDQATIMNSELKDKELALLEYLISALHQILPFDAAIAELQRRQARSHVELAQEQISDSDDSLAEIWPSKPTTSSTRPKVNPLDLPLGLDGKPIPFWLYKLHGLGIEYDCEICGNFKYKGRRAFELHFQEARHTQALKLLGIQNSAAFKDVVKIEDAVQLQLKLANLAAQPEFEDSMGNVLSRRDYLDLLKQGLL